MIEEQWNDEPSFNVVLHWSFRNDGKSTMVVDPIDVREWLMSGKMGFEEAKSAELTDVLLSEYFEYRENSGILEIDTDDLIGGGELEVDRVEELSA